MAVLLTYIPDVHFSLSLFTLFTLAVSLHSNRTKIRRIQGKGGTYTQKFRKSSQISFIDFWKNMFVQVKH
jgi:hypothetical protein